MTTMLNKYVIEFLKAKSERLSDTFQWILKRLK